MRRVDGTGKRLTREVGAVIKSHTGRLRFALAFPNSYYLGMSSLGFQTVYRLLNAREDTVCERVFLPDAEKMAELRRTGHPLCTVESRVPVRDFDVLAFSVPFEMDYPGILKILALSGLAERAEDRARESRAPLVIAGGPAVTMNPEAPASFIDAFLIGEAEEALPELVDVLGVCRNCGREELLHALSDIRGVYVPRLYEPEYGEDGMLRRVRASSGAPAVIKRRWVRNVDANPAVSAILTPHTEFSDTVLVEISRGCRRRCRFCAAGYIYLPPRSRRPEAVLADIRRVQTAVGEHMGGRLKAGLVSASVFDHPEALSICRSLADGGGLFSISSTRADTLTTEVAEALHRGGQETLTIAPEAGTERLRQVINKRITDSQILCAAKNAWDAGFRRLRLYFMVGLPTETEADVAGISDLVERIAGSRRWERLTVSVSCFVPKPWTPFQWVAMEDEKVLRRKRDAVKSALRPAASVEVTGESPRESVVQAVLARGDRRLGDALVAMSRGGISWREAFRKCGVDHAFYAHRTRGREEVFAWDHLNMGVSRENLWREYERALGTLSDRPPHISPGE